MQYILPLIAIVLGTLKLLGHITLSWWWIALIWPIIPLVFATVTLFGVLGLAFWASKR